MICDQIIKDIFTSESSRIAPHVEFLCLLCAQIWMKSW